MDDVSLPHEEPDMTTLSLDRDEGTQDPDAEAHSPRLPPRWFIRTAWIAHRAMYRVTGGRRGLWRPEPGRWGTMRLFTVGRKSGQRPRGDPRLLRGRAQHRDDGDERLGRGRARLVAEPPGAAGCHDRGEGHGRRCRSVATLPRVRNATASGRCGAPTTRTSTATRRAGRRKRRWSSSSRALIDAPRRRRVDSYPTKSLGYRGHDPDRFRDARHDRSDPRLAYPRQRRHRLLDEG